VRGNTPRNAPPRPKIRLATTALTSCPYPLLFSPSALDLILAILKIPKSCKSRFRQH